MKLLQSVSRVVPAAPEAIFAYLADASRHPEIDGSGTVVELRGDPRPLGLGSTFSMGMKMGIEYTMISTVVEYEENRRIAWQARPDNKVIGMGLGGRIWRYELEPVEGGTEVTETWDVSQEALPSRYLVALTMAEQTRKNMTRTLERIEELVTQV